MSTTPKAEWYSEGVIKLSRGNDESASVYLTPEEAKEIMRFVLAANDAQ